MKDKDKDRDPDKARKRALADLRCAVRKLTDAGQSIDALEQLVRDAYWQHVNRQAWDGPDSTQAHALRSPIGDNMNTNENTDRTPARLSRTVLRAFYAIQVPGFTIDTAAIVAAQGWVDRIEDAGAKTGREVALAIRNFDWMRDESAHPVKPSDAIKGERMLSVLATYAAGGPVAVRAMIDAYWEHVNR